MNKNRIFKKAFEAELVKLRFELKAFEAELVKLRFELKARQHRNAQAPVPEHNYAGHYLDGQEAMLLNIMNFMRSEIV